MLNCLGVVEKKVEPAQIEKEMQYLYDTEDAIFG